MENYLVGWYVDIYKNAYGVSTDYSDIILTFNTYLKRIINGTAFETFSSIVMAVGIALLLFHFFSDMTERAVSKQTSILTTGKSFGFLFVSLFVLFHTKEIFIFLLKFTEGMNESLSVADSGNEYITSYLENEIVLTLLGRCVENYMGLWDIVGYTLMALPMVLVSFVTKIYVTYFAATRIIQLFVYYLFAPVGVSDLSEGAPGGGINLYSSGMRYLRIMLSIMLQVFVITMTSQVFPLMTSAVNSLWFSDRETVVSSEGEAEASYGRSSTYPLRHFEYTDHYSAVREIVTISNNKVLERLTVDEEDEEAEALQSNEIYELSDVVSSTGTDMGKTKEDDTAQEKAEEILSNERYRMTISSTSLFFDWCTGSDGSKMILLILQMILKIMMIVTAPRLCNRIAGVSV